MCSNSSAPYSWDSIKKSILQKCAKTIEALSVRDIKTAIINNCQKYLEFASEMSDDISFIKHPLFSVNGAAIIAQFKEYQSGSKTLHEALWWCKEEYEMDVLFGPIDDSILYDEYDDDDSDWLTKS